MAVAVWPWPVVGLAGWRLWPDGRWLFACGLVAGAGAWPWPWPDGGGCLRGRMAGPCPNCAGPGLNQG